MNSITQKEFITDLSSNGKQQRNELRTLGVEFMGALFMVLLAFTYNYYPTVAVIVFSLYCVVEFLISSLFRFTISKMLSEDSFTRIMESFSSTEELNKFFKSMSGIFGIMLSSKTYLILLFFIQMGIVYSFAHFGLMTEAMVLFGIYAYEDIMRKTNKKQILHVIGEN